MYRNSEYYAAPTEGAAIAHVMAEERRQKKKGQREQEQALRRAEQAKRQRKKEIAKAKKRERLANCVYVRAWEATEQNSRWMKEKAEGKG